MAGHAHCRPKGLERPLALARCETMANACSIAGRQLAITPFSDPGLHNMINRVPHWAPSSAKCPSDCPGTSWAEEGLQNPAGNELNQVVPHQSAPCPAQRLNLSTRAALGGDAENCRQRPKGPGANSGRAEAVKAQEKGLGIHQSLRAQLQSTLPP